MTVCRAIEKNKKKTFEKEEPFAREENQQGKMEKNKERNSRKQQTRISEGEGIRKRQRKTDEI